MGKSQIQCFEKIDGDRENLFVIGIPYGFAEIYQESGEEGIVSASIFVLGTYLKKLFEKQKLSVHIDIEADLMVLSFREKDSGFIGLISKALESLFTIRLEKEKFKELKLASLEEMKCHFKKIIYRGWFRIQEFVHQKKGFLSEDIMKNLYRISFEQFEEFVGHSLKP